MRDQLNLTKLILCCSALLVAIPQAFAGQAGQEIVIPLKLNLRSKNSIWMTVNLTDERVIEKPGTTSVGLAPGGVKIRLGKPGKSAEAGEVSVGTDGNQEKETTYPIRPDEPIRVEVTRKFATGRSIRLPYLLKWSRETKSNKEVESLSWTPDYRAEGSFQTGSCRATIAAFDANGDGVFDGRDFLLGTSIGLDRNEDGRIYGRNEWLMGNQIIEFCDNQFLIKKLVEDGSSITLVPTALRSPRIGEPVPVLTLTCIKGEKISTADFKGQVTVLDFWASWCGPCVGEFPNLNKLYEQYKSQFRVISISVDDSGQVSQARDVVEKHRLSWPVVIQGLGQDDPIWKVFGSMADNRLAIPLYVVVKKDGTIGYAGNGGIGLKELRDQLAKEVR